MEITPELPDGFTGTIKRLHCAVCHTVFFVPQAFYEAYQPAFCHECSIKKKEQELLTQQQAALQAQDTEEEAWVRRHISGNRKGYEMFSCTNVSNTTGRAWEVLLRKKISKHYTEVVCDRLMELSKSDIGSSFFYFPNWRPSYKYRTRDADEINEFLQTLKQMGHLSLEEKTAWIRKWLTTNNEEP